MWVQFPLLAPIKFGLDLPAKVFIPSVALGKIVGVVGNEARMVIKLLYGSLG